jgi:hypothetical protein
VMGMLERTAATLSDPEPRTTCMRWLEAEKDWIAQTNDGSSLIAWAVLDNGKAVASVVVETSPLENLLAINGGDASLEALAEAYMIGHPKEYWNVDSVTADQVTLLVRYERPNDDPEAPELVVLRPAGYWLYTVRYSCPQGYWDAMYDTFKTSATTIVIM